jgi:hypothetical protein
MRSYVRPGPEAGSEILSINGIDAAELVQRCGRGVPIDGRATMRRIRKVEYEFDYWCGPVLGFPCVFSLKVRAPGTSDVVAFEIPAIGRDSLVRAGKALFPADPPGVAKPPFELEMLDGGKIAVMTVRTFSKDDSFDPAKSFGSVFGRLKAAGTTDLVIDIRGNGGGRDTNAALLYSYIAADTFRYVSQRLINQKRFAFIRETDDWFLNFASFLLKTKNLPDGRYQIDMGIDHLQKPRQDRFAGRVYVLTDARTFSTASEFATLVKFYKRGSIVGEETGNAYGGDSGAIVSYVL